MADAYSNYLRDALNDHFRGGTAYTPAATHYYALMTTMPGPAGGGVEASGGSYGRVAYTNDTANYPAPSGGVVQNANPIDWGTLSATLGTIVGVAVYDASTGGNLLAFALLTTPTVINAGNPFQLPANSATFTYDASCNWSIYLQNKMLGLVFGGTSFTPPATTYFALMNVMPTASGGGTEASGGTYGRVALTSGTTNWPASSGQLIQSAAVIDWGIATANLGSVPGTAEYDASSGGNLLTFTPFTGGAVTINIGTPFQLPVGGFQNSWAA